MTRTRLIATIVVVAVLAVGLAAFTFLRTSSEASAPDCWRSWGFVPVHPERGPVDQKPPTDPGPHQILLGQWDGAVDWTFTIEDPGTLTPEPGGPEPIVGRGTFRWDPSALAESNARYEFGPVTSPPAYGVVAIGNDLWERSRGGPWRRCKDVDPTKRAPVSWGAFQITRNHSGRDGYPINLLPGTPFTVEPIDPQPDAEFIKYGVQMPEGYDWVTLELTLDQHGQLRRAEATDTASKALYYRYTADPASSSAPITAPPI
jgi:hypothetical protein